ncbi:MAG: riboflavin synthase [Spirochaetota bacterium]
MFTGIIEEIGVIQSVSRERNGLRMRCSAHMVLEGTKVGDSVSINGVCQTVEKVGDGSFVFFVSRVTETVTTLATVSAGCRVNLERALRLSDRLGGHIVQGHVDCTGRITSVNPLENGFEIMISVLGEGTRYIAEKGSVAVNGVSLTVVSKRENSFSLYLIPESMKKTNLTALRPGDTVNIEFDILAKYVEQLFRNGESRSIIDIMTDSGFM